MLLKVSAGALLAFFPGRRTTGDQLTRGITLLVPRIDADKFIQRQIIVLPPRTEGGEYSNKQRAKNIDHRKRGDPQLLHDP
jgi:hypothetical protein